MAKSISYGSYKLEYSPFSKQWYVLDWDYEDPEGYVVASFASKYAAMNWIDQRGG
jgi:hypothetical protein